jgi:hypothetical protein
MAMIWRNILTNVGAVIVFIHTVYPGVNAEAIIQAVTDGTILNHIGNLLLIYFLYRDGKPEPKKIEYVTTKDGQ